MQYTYRWSMNSPEASILTIFYIFVCLTEPTVFTKNTADT